MTSKAIIIGLPETCRRLERQLDLLPDRPMSIGWIVAQDTQHTAQPGDPILGYAADIESVIWQQKPDIAMVCLPASMHALIASVRTQLRKLGVPDRFMPTLEDQLAGVGPRSMIDVDPHDLMGRPPRSVDDESIGRLVAGKRVLITGAGGTIGGELARIVAGYEPDQLVLVERSENALFEIDRQIARRNPQLTRHALLHDVVDTHATLDEFRHLRPGIVFHAAAHKHVPMMEDHPSAAVDNNLFGTKAVVDAAEAVGADHVVMISTDKAVNPSSIMGATKRLAEMYVQLRGANSGTAFSIVRFGNVLGSSGSVLDIWKRQLADGGPLTVTDPKMTRFFMTIPEAASLVIQAAALHEADDAGSVVYVLDMGEPVRILDLAQRLIECHGLLPRLSSSAGDARCGSSGSVSIVNTGTRPGEKLHEELATEGQALLPTRHPDINIWQLPEPDPRAVQMALDVLDPVKRSRNAVEVARVVRKLVPEMAEPVAA